jgi:hypothetical protein
MPRKSLRPELNRIRGWVRQGRTDAWIAHQLEVTVQQIQAFKREQSLEPGSDGEAVESSAATADFDDEIDLRGQDDALIAAELDAEAEAKAAAEQEAAEKAAAEAAEKAAARAARIAAGEDDEDDEDEADEDKPKRRRGRRGGRSTRRKKPVGPLEGTFDHGEEGYGLWLDPSVQDDPVYAEHWAGHRSVEVTIEEDQIIIRRIVTDADADADSDADSGPDEVEADVDVTPAEAEPEVPVPADTEPDEPDEPTAED